MYLVSSYFSAVTLLSVMGSLFLPAQFSFVTEALFTSPLDLVEEGYNFVASQTLYGVDVMLLPAVGVVLAIVFMLVLTPLVIRLAHRMGWLAYPKDDRWHDKPIALMGGIAMYGAAALAIGIGGAWMAFPWPVWLGATLLFLAGVFDDLLTLRPETKLVAQILGTVLLLYAGYAFWRGGPVWVSVPLTFIWVIGITNALNLIDGMDGLAAGISAIAALVLAVIAWLLNLPFVSAAAAAVGGAGIGFLFFNFKPARIFMGDGGSMFLGYMLAATALSVQGQGGPVSATLVPVVVLAVPIFDTTFVTITRILNGRPVTQGGTDHTMHRMVLLGLSERHTVLALYGVSAAFGSLALIVHWSGLQLFYALMLLAIVSSVVFALHLASYPAAGDPVMRAPESFTRSQRFGAFMQAITGGAYWKTIAGIMADLLLTIAAFIVAHYLRFEGALTLSHENIMIKALPGVVGIKVFIFYAFGLYHGIWRHAGTPELVRIMNASSVASAASSIGLISVFGWTELSVAVLVLDWMICTVSIAGSRFGFRGLRQYFAAQRRTGRRVLLYGAGPNGLLALRHLRQDWELGRTVVGLIDDDRTKSGLRVQGLSILGTADDLPTLADQYHIDEVIVPTGDMSDQQISAIYDRCTEAGIVCRHFTLSLRPASPRPAYKASHFSGDGSNATPILSNN